MSTKDKIGLVIALSILFYAVGPPWPVAITLAVLVALLAEPLALRLENWKRRRRIP